MSNKRKIAIISIIITILILGINIISNAKDKDWSLKVNDKVYLGQDDYWENYPNDIFCIQRGQALSKQPAEYKVKAVVDIKGSRAEGSDGTVSNDWRNAKLAAILSEEQDKYSIYYGNVAQKESGIVANEIWGFMYEWLENVGYKYHKIPKSIAYEDSVSSGYTTPNHLKDDVFKNATNDYKIEKSGSATIKVEAYQKDNKQYMRIGPFRWNFDGKLTDIQIYDQNGKQIAQKYYSKFNGTTNKFVNVGDIKSGEDFYISIPVDSSITKITKIKAKAEVAANGVTVWFLESSGWSLQNLIIREPNSGTTVIEEELKYDIPMLGNLKVIKVNQANQQVRLSGVGFYIQNKNTGKYVKEATDGTISYVDNKDKATEYVTDKNGEITIKNLIVGTYVAYETKNPNYGYEIVTDGMQKEVVVDKTAELKIPNKQKYIKLSGYVWVDNISGKQSTIDNLYNDKDSDDMLLDGITVRLKDRTTGETVRETITANGGKYLFTDVLVDDLDKYYIEFEYDGLTYTNVVPHIDKDNGSKSAENITVRDNFNKGFSVVEGKSENQSITRDSNNNETHTLTYNSDKTAHTSTLIKVEPESMITANTDEAKYSIKAYYVPGQEEIKYINLGLYEREQPDISLVKDLHSVKLSINGYNNIYNYSQRFKEDYKPTEDDLNVGVKYKNEYTGSYNRAIYKADYIYNDGDTTENSKNLKVYLTYKIRLINETTGLSVKVNNIVDYYDEKYNLKDIEAIGRNVNEKGVITETGGITYNKETYGNGYSKVIINTNTQINPQGMADIYVQFELDREAVISILSGEERLDNVAEINSYSIFDTNGNAYAGIDKDSNPGNAIPGDVTTYQDDTDSAPSLQLEVTEARKMTGTVFLDESTGGVGKVRQGDGEYKEGEKGIAGVEVILTETTGTGLVYKATTNENGYFEFTDYIPGDYTLTYRWGDETYTVQNYKGTIYNDKDRANNKEWYRTTAPRYSDAIDDYTLRQAIDEEMKDITNKTETTINKMNSTTPIMGIGVENVDTSTAAIGNRYEFTISNIDFGIVERAKQDVTLGKRVATFKVTLANGQVIADVTIDENGKMTGERNHVTYMGPSSATMPNNGYVKLELDSELIQGAKVEVGYEIKVINNSELDYLSENFYKYGIIEGKAVTITPTAIIDYLDKDWAFDATKNENWEVKTLDEIKDIVAETVYNNEDSDISEKTILYTESLNTEKLEPTKSATVMINVSKLLSNSDEIALDNETEVVRLVKTGGSKPIPEPGNYIPGTGDTESDSDIAETVIVTPNTGDNLNFIIPVIVATIALAILGVGVVTIKKKTL